MSSGDDTVYLPPYGDIVFKLIASTMRAGAEMVRAIGQGEGVDEVSDRDINKHFVWLNQEVWAKAGGVSRYLFEPPDSVGRSASSLRSGPQKIPSALRGRLMRGLSPDSAYNERKDRYDPQAYIPQGQTRISGLIRNSFRGTRYAGAEISIPSPLRIVHDFLTDPDMPGTRAYVLLTLRNLIFETVGAFPRMHGNEKIQNVFSVKDVEAAMGRVWTAVRPRFQSKGYNPFSPEGDWPVDAVVRHILALKGFIYLRFSDVSVCLEYLETGGFGNSLPFQCQKAPFVKTLPALGEIVNELWGLPLPIRGADTVFRGGLKFSETGGLVMALHGGPGAGKTSVALAFGAYLAPFGIKTLFVTAEEDAADLMARMEGLVPDGMSRLAFFPPDLTQWVEFHKPKIDADDPAAAARLTEGIRTLAGDMGKASPEPAANVAPVPCEAVVVLDGIHDFFACSGDGDQSLRALYKLVEACRQLKALVILTTGDEWKENPRLDYLVDVAIRLSHKSMDEYGTKPDRRLMLTKARHQLCANGVHGLQIAGHKGVRFSPQINYQLEKRSAWETLLPDNNIVKNVLRNSAQLIPRNDESMPTRHMQFSNSTQSVNIYSGAHLFINGRGSGGKAALALKLAMAPAFEKSGANFSYVKRKENILIVSFLYPEEYYRTIFSRLLRQHSFEYRVFSDALQSRSSSEGGESGDGDGGAHLRVIHFYPGHLRPNDLFNRVEWELDAAALRGNPYTSIIIDGIHNVFIQFPEIEKYSLLWPQLYNSLRSRPITVITTHTTLMVPDAADLELNVNIDDRRSEPLRHALVQKTDFQFEVDPFLPANAGKQLEVAPLKVDWSSYDLTDLFAVRTLSAIGQPIPSGNVLWSRRRLVLFKNPAFETQKPIPRDLQGDLFLNPTADVVTDMF